MENPEPDGFHEIGCKKCDCFPSEWAFFYNSWSKKLRIICQNCGHNIECDSDIYIGDKPEVAVMNFRFFT